MDNISMCRIESKSIINASVSVHHDDSQKSRTQRCDSSTWLIQKAVFDPKKALSLVNSTKRN